MSLYSVAFGVFTGLAKKRRRSERIRNKKLVRCNLSIVHLCENVGAFENALSVVLCVDYGVRGTEKLFIVFG